MLVPAAALLSVSARAAPPTGPCEAALAGATARSGVPKGLLAAIGVVESGRPDPVTGLVRPWPWTIDAAGQPAYFASKAEAIAAVQALQARGIVSIDVGCMQINLMHHPDAFASLDDAFDPPRNVAYAVRFLTRLYGQTRDWAEAAALYHSATPDLAEPYQRRVLAAWGVALPPTPPEQPSVPLRVPLSATAPTGRVAVMLPAAPGQDIRVLPLAR